MRAGGAEKERALAVLDYALFRILKLLHPFMPFITEELAHRMGFVEEGKSIMYTAWPEADPAAAFDPAETALTDGKFELVRIGRFLRSSYNIPDGKKLDFHIKAAGEKELQALLAQKASLELLLNAGGIEISLSPFDSAAHGAAPSQPGAMGVISLPLAGLIDVAAEIARLEKQLKDINGWIASAKGKLANERFVKNAPPQVVADARAGLADLETRKTRTEELLSSLKG